MGRQENISMKKWQKSLLVSLVITGVLAGIFYYFFLPPLNIRSIEMWIYAVVVLGVFALLNAVGNADWKSEKPGKAKKTVGDRITSAALMLAGIGVIAGVLLVLFSSSLFHAKAYSGILEVQEDCSFEDDLAETVSTDAIAIMDTDSARMLGNRKIGSLTELVSQYDVSEDYSQISYQNTPAKIAALEYAGFFKYMKNRKTGIPGYVMVSPVDMSAQYVELDEKMQYVPSAYFSKDLVRHIRSKYRTEMIWDTWFEVDEEGKPYYVASVYSCKVGLFGGEDIVGAIVVDPVSGDMEYYDTEDVPGWVDIVYDGDLLCSQYDYYGQLRKGFWNSKFSAEGCKVTTSNYGYIAKDNDIWVYTGVTSVNSDASNIGFVLMNERTKEAKFYTIAGADEASAMTAAEGEVQQYGYTASFPSLINVDGNATYIMVLKDDGGLVKMYAAVNAEQYNMVTTASDQKECIEKYRKMMASGDPEYDGESDGAGSSDDTDAAQQGEKADESLYEERAVTVKKLEKIVVDGDTWLYLLTEDGTIYHAKYTDVLSMMGVSEGDQITIKVYGDLFLK